MPKISIITVVYNGEGVLQPTVESVIDQDYKDYEYLIIDGKSTDSTLDIISKFEAGITSYISEPDQGVYDAMNKGLELASGQYILFLNAGDELASPSTLASLFDHEQKPDLIYGETLIMNPEKRVIGTRTQLTSRKLPTHLTKNDFLNGQVVSHQSFIPRLELCPKYDLRYQCSSDIDWMLKIVDQCQSIVKSDQPISKYLQGGISDVQLKTCWKERFIILLRHFSYWKVCLVHIKFIWRFLLIGAYKK